MDVLQIVSKDLCYKNVVNERFQVLLVCLTKGLGILAVKMINFHYKLYAFMILISMCVSA